MSITCTGRVPWFHQTSHRNRVIIKVSSGTPKVWVEDPWTKSGICPSGWRRDILWALSVLSHQTACKHVTRSRRCDTAVTSKRVLVGNEIKLRYGWYRMIGSRTSNISLRQRDFGYDVRGSNDHYVIVEYVGVIMDLQVPLLIIGARGVSTMSTIFTNP